MLMIVASDGDGAGEGVNGRRATSMYEMSNVDFVMDFAKKFVAASPLIAAGLVELTTWSEGEKPSGRTREELLNKGVAVFYVEPLDFPRFVDAELPVLR